MFGLLFLVRTCTPLKQELDAMDLPTGSPKIALYKSNSLNFTNLHLVLSFLLVAADIISTPLNCQLTKLLIGLS